MTERRKKKLNCLGGGGGKIEGLEGGKPWSRARREEREGREGEREKGLWSRLVGFNIAKLSLLLAPCTSAHT